MSVSSDYSSVNENNKTTTDFPYQNKIEHYCITAFLLFFCYPCYTYAYFGFFQTCIPTDRLEPCEFDGKMTFFDIYALKKNVNYFQKKHDEITSVMQYGLSAESSKTLLQKQNSINETLEALKQNFNNQKTHFEDCYNNNYKTMNNRRLLFMYFSSLLLICIITYLTVKTFYFFKKVPLSELNEKQKISFCKLIAWCIFFFVLLVIFAYFYISIMFGFRSEMEKIPDIPIFVAETWKETCRKETNIITVDEFIYEKTV